MERADPVGGYTYIEEHFPLDSMHGRIPLGNILDVDKDHLVFAGNDPRLASFKADRTLFFDLETTGLRQDEDTYAFLIGAARLEGNDLVVRQYFLEDPEAEASMLFDVYNYFREFSGIVTYNGACFDLPFLKTRFLLKGVAEGLRTEYHLDLLLTARRYWKHRLPSCRLKEVENNLLGIERVGDVEGWEIPSLYLDYQRNGNREGLSSIFLHNSLDTRSLVALTIVAADHISRALSGNSIHPQDAYIVGRNMEKLNLLDEAAAQFRASASGLSGDHRYQALERLSLILKRQARWPEAEKTWHKMIDEYPQATFAFIELSKYYEHHTGNLGKAIKMALRSLDLMQSMGRNPAKSEEGCQSMRKKMEHRRRRLERKLSTRD